MSEPSTPYTPASTSTTVARNETLTLADKIKKYDTTKLVDLLREEKDLGLNDEDLEIICKRKINGWAFLKMDQQDFRDSGFKIGTAIVLADFAEKCKEKKKRAIDESSKEFKLCIDDILRRIKNMGPVVDSNEAMRCKYISTILYTAVSILGGLVILPQMNVSGEENSSCVDYAIKKILDDLLEKIICITEGKQNQLGKGVAQNLMQCRSSCEMNLDTLKKKRKTEEAFKEYEYVYGIVTTATDWYFILHSTEAIYCTSKTEYHISLTEPIYVKM
ncbi:hypothetical protein GLOIN_2v1649992 [Rhizophagus irregularis DAOM 181602=DAOM 197198]|uniref:SAM domain-containing protein n=1 Tax=Rhizophagus irregularis (strain DAOM 181602 / DAOM 197198 / MUCL 43194) TaxID=747089 RepID=A0A2P4PPB5_RHIID|nr:hypothetical protein GLOIN_2v1649992 [Rhizophagus irregularis DAOM 181602=DAOM 197198]POG67244.1 hypothetical protein GLOIN_2v1649992 [Rhizophagus irregularis DAOM 181602=DAOM 197198]|eukprot:XP_025174110.1 hypothetical protein GLOIN_2v1649992 [Rhizophagus irregularis DAOM 181602=DAOM 197198]